MISLNSISFLVWLPFVGYIILGSMLSGLELLSWSAFFIVIFVVNLLFLVTSFFVKKESSRRFYLFNLLFLIVSCASFIKYLYLWVNFI